MLISDNFHDLITIFLIIALYFLCISLCILLSQMAFHSKNKSSGKTTNDSFSIYSDSRHDSGDSGCDSSDSGGGDGGGD